MEADWKKRPSGRGLAGVGLALIGLATGPAAQGEDWFKVDELRPGSFGGSYGGPNVRHFGTAISLLGDRALVGAEGLYGDEGSAYVFTLEGGRWAPTVELDSPLTDPNAGFGKAVALGEDFAFVGAPDADGGAGAAVTYARVGSQWFETQELKRLNRSSTDGYATAIVVHGRSALVGCPGTEQVHVYDDIGGVWMQTAVLTPAGGTTRRGSRFGSALQYDGSTAIVGAPGDGKVHVFHRLNPGWARGQVFGGDKTLDDFGASLALSDDWLLVGAPDDEGDGAVVVHELDPTTGSWTPRATLRPQGLPGSLVFGQSVDLSGDHAIVGAPDVLSVLGNAVIYWHGGDEWVEQTVLVPDIAPGEGRYGTAVALQNDVVMVNVGLDDSGVIGYFGAIHVWLAAENYRLSHRGDVE